MKWPKLSTVPARQRLLVATSLTRLAARRARCSKPAFDEGMLSSLPFDVTEPADCCSQQVFHFVVELLSSFDEGADILVSEIGLFAAETDLVDLSFRQGPGVFKLRSFSRFT